MTDVAASLWMALKVQACVHPETAARIVTLSPAEFERAFTAWSADKVILPIRRNIPEHEHYDLIT
jgi:hypothetical protein